MGRTEKDFDPKEEDRDPEKEEQKEELTLIDSDTFYDLLMEQQEQM